MTSQALVTNDLAAKRSAAASKAWETRRRLAGMHNPAHNSRPLSAMPSKDVAVEALAVFEREAQSDMPDWHKAALKLRAALDRRTQNREITFARPRLAPAALPQPRWPDYPVDHLSAFKVRNPTIIVTFADGEIVRAPAVSALNKPLNIGRGLRVAIAFYQARIAWRAGLKNRPGYWREVPAIAACVSEDGETFDPAQCTVRTVESRKAKDWRIRR